MAARARGAARDLAGGSDLGQPLARLVTALTKISTFESSYSSVEATEAENFRRLLLASVDDVDFFLFTQLNVRTIEFVMNNLGHAMVRMAH